MNKTSIENYISYADHIMPYAKDAITYIEFETLYQIDKMIFGKCKTYLPKMPIFPMAVISTMGQLTINSALDTFDSATLVASALSSYGAMIQSNPFKLAGISMNLYNIYSNHGGKPDEVACIECEILSEVQNSSFINHFNISGHNYFNFSGEHHFNISYHD